MMRKDGHGYGDDYDERHPVRDTVAAALLFAFVVGLMILSVWPRSEAPKSPPTQTAAPDASSR